MEIAMFPSDRKTHRSGMKNISTAGFPTCFGVQSGSRFPPMYYRLDRGVVLRRQAFQETLGPSNAADERRKAVRRSKSG